MPRSVLLALRTLLVLLFAAAVALQVTCGALFGTVPGAARGTALVTLVVAGALCVEVVLISVWMLVSQVRAGVIFDETGRADGWVNAAVGALATAAVIAAGGCLWLLLIDLAAPAPGGIALALLAATAAGVAAALALLVAVMRRLLHAAMRLQSELAEVV
ncbi:DUF2975 domain-containing protein [Cryobacterium arcticum]|nr:DUF2975 domain-containing protein [Cryobacterium arcticum]